MDFVKMQGLGNDFVVFTSPLDPDPARIQQWCDRRTGIGADGVLEALPVDATTVSMRYWNADGSPAEMCGNGLRCVAWLAHSRGWVDGDSFTVETDAGPLGVSITGDNMVRAAVGAAQRHRITDLAVGGQTVHPVGIGNPHAVLFVEDTSLAPVETVGPRVGEDPLFPDGANVEFLHVVDEETIDLRVWERGVGETLACATGAAAAGFVAHDQGKTGNRVNVRLPGGDLLIGLEDDSVWMEGPAHEVFA
ncbi:MAG: diaminopimelate epimerase, partial [Acidimicrobiia bacterium]|nr:diaminopimelate epimerase [Acidimicrobiia bacterium]